jgi:hypothetical protein
VNIEKISTILSLTGDIKSLSGMPRVTVGALMARVSVPMDLQRYQISVSPLRRVFGVTSWSAVASEGEGEGVLSTIPRCPKGRGPPPLPKSYLHSHPGAIGVKSPSFINEIYPEPFWEA